MKAKRKSKAVRILKKDVKKIDPKDIVAKSASIVCDILKSFKTGGIDKATIGAGADRTIDIKRERDLIKVPIRNARSAISSVLLPRFLVEAEYIINLPVFRSHFNMVFTNALKNWKVMVQDRVKVSHVRRKAGPAIK